MTPLVLLHGFTGSPSTFDEVLAHVDPARPVLVPWLSGHGGGRFAPGIVSFETEVDRLAALIRAFEPAPVHVAGYSLGARLLLGLLARHPERCARATLISVTPGLPDEAARAARRRQDDRWLSLLRAGDLRGFVAAWERQPLFLSQASWPAARRAAQRKERLDHDALGLAQALERLGLGVMPDPIPALASGRVPIDLVIGAEDRACQERAIRLTTARPDARLHVLPGAGHNVPRETPLALARILNEESNP